MGSSQSFRNVRNVILRALKWLFFSEKLLSCWGFAPLNPICDTQRWSPRGHILKSLASKVNSLASKPQVLENCPALGSRTALFFVPLKSCWKTPEISRKTCEYLFLFSAIGDLLKNFIIIIINGQRYKRICYRYVKSSYTLRRPHLGPSQL